jgi:hypothetical protein
MFYVYVIVLFNFFHVQQAVLERQYADLPACERARVKLGYAQISPLGVHGECQMIAISPPTAVPPAK